MVEDVGIFTFAIPTVALVVNTCPVNCDDDVIEPWGGVVTLGGIICST